MITMLEVQDDFKSKLKLAKDPNTSPEVLKGFYDMYKNDRTSGYQMLSVLARNPNTLVSTLRAIANKGWYSDELSKNPSVPQSVLKKMYADAPSNLKTRIMKNPQMKGADRKQLLNQGHEKFFDEFVGQDVWVEASSYGIARDYECFVRLLSKKRKSNFKDVYTYNLVYDKLYNVDELEQDMEEVETGIVGEYEDSYADICIYSTNPKTYTTDQLIDLLT